MDGMREGGREEGSEDCREGERVAGKGREKNEGSGV